MRRSNSLLNNLAATMPAQTGAAHPHQGLYAAPQPGNVHPAYYDSAPNSGYAYPQAQVLPPQMQPVQTYYPPYTQSQYAQPSQGRENAAGLQELHMAQANLDALVGRLGEITASHEARLRDTSGTDALTANVQRLSQAVVEMQTGLSSLQNISQQPDRIPEIKSMIDGLHQKVNASLSSIPQSQIDPSAYAKVVEASHSEVLNEVRNIHSAVAMSNQNHASMTQILGSHREDVLQRLEMLSGRLGELDRSQDKAELFALRQQMENLDAVVRESMANSGGGQVDEESLNERLEEITRAILALSGTGTGIDNLERLEARVIELSKSLQENTRASERNPNKLEAFFGETRTALKALDDRVSEMSAREPSSGPNDILLEQIRELSERVSKLSSFEETASFVSTRDNPALLNRLDEVVDRIETLQNGGMGEDDRFEQVFERLDRISVQIQERPKGKKLKSETGKKDSSAAEKQIIARLDQVLQGIDTLDPLGENSAIHEHVAALNEQLEGISAALETFQSPAGMLHPIENRLESIEQQLGASRDIGIELAAGAAEDVVRRVMSEISPGGNPDPDVLQGLWDDIRKLNEANETASAEADEDVAFVKQSLQTIVMRLGALESNLELLRQQPAVAAPTAEPQYATQPKVAAVEPAFEEPRDEPVADIADHYATPPVAEPVAMPEPVGMPEPEFEEPFNPPKSEKEMSAGEHLVKAARLAEQERQRAKHEEEERYASESGIPHRNELDANLPKTPPELADVEQMTLPKVNAPQMDFDDGSILSDRYDDAVGDVNIGDRDMPLEPGSGGPDLAALVRQANERRKSLVERGEETSGTDFLAAARRAAQAAAQEASEVEAEKQDPETSKGLIGRITGMLSGGGKKNMLVAGLLLLGTAVAIPVVSKFAFDGKNIRISELATASVGSPATSAIGGEGEGTTTLSANSAGSSRLTSQAPIASRGIDNRVDEELTPASLGGAEPTLPFDHAEVQAFPQDLRDAALASDPLAVFEVARRYTSGVGVERDLEKASRYYAHAAEAGFVPAQYFIGNFYEKGIGVDLDRTVAQAWYEQAAYGGHVVAMHNLGVMFASADPATGKADLEKAHSWFEKAASHGVRDSQVNLGIFHAKGMAGEINLIESYKWLALAARSGDKDALEKRELIADAMRPDQLEEAKQLVEEWRELEVDQAVNNVEIPQSWQEGTGVARLLDDPETIAQAQLLLGKVGFDAGPADGVMGRKTRTAIRNFRSRTGLPVTDKLDTQVMQALKAVAI